MAASRCWTCWAVGLGLWGIVGCSQSTDPAVDQVGSDASSQDTGVQYDAASDPDSATPIEADAPSDAFVEAATEAGEASVDAAVELGFRNLGFEEADATGAPAAWTCEFFSEDATGTACVGLEESSPEGHRHLRLQPNAYAIQVTKQLPPGVSVRVRYAARSTAELRVGYTLWLQGVRDGALVWQSVGKEHEEGDWWHINTHTGQIDDSIDTLRLLLINANSEEPIDFDDIQVIVEQEPWEFDGHLLMAEHRGSFSCNSTATPSQLWVPLPMDHGIQVPLSVELEVIPADVAQSIEYSVDPLGNFGATVHVADTTVANSAQLNWKGLVLTIEQPLSALPSYYADNSNPSDWLAPTAIVQWDDPQLQATAQQACQGITDPEAKMLAVLGWTSQWITNESMMTGLDALTVFQTKNGSCTGFANLGAAAGRANGLPTRSIANYMVDFGGQQTHYIDEFYLGPGLAWRLVEPQSTDARVSADYAVVVRVNTIDDEGPDAMTQPMVMPGVPLRSLANVLVGQSKCHFQMNSPFPGAMYCDNRPMYWMGLRKDSRDMTALFQRARATWAKYLTSVQSPQGVSQQERTVRAQAYQIKSKAELETWIELVEAL